MKNARITGAALGLAAALAVGFVSAQATTAESIVSRVEANQKTLRDVSFKVTGNVSLEGSQQRFDVDVQSIPAQNLVRVNFNAPDMLADNVVIVDKDTVYNYLFLTNQVTVQKTNRAAQTAGFNVDLSRFADPSNLLSSNYNIKLIESNTQNGARVHLLEATAKDGGTDRTRVWITEAGWRPTRVQVLGSSNRVIADLNVANYRTNAGLTAARVKALPRDAEVIRR